MNWTKIIKEYNEWLSFPVAFLLFFLTPKVYQWFDPTAGAFDAGVFHSAIYAIAVLSLFSGVAWLFLKLKFPTLKKYLDDSAEDDLIDFENKTAPITAFAIYFGYMILLYLILNTL